MKIKEKSFSHESAVLSLINKYFWKSKIGPLISLLLPIMFMVIYKILSKQDPSLFASGLSVYFSFSILPLLLVTLPQLIVEFKTSIILRKISVSSISSIKFSAILLLYYLLMTISSNIIVIIVYACFLNKDASHFFGLINWFQLIYALLNIYLITLSLGLLIGVLTKKNSSVQIIGFAIMIVSILFAGQFIPMSVIARNDALRYISLFSPITYGLSLANNVLMITDTSTISALPIDPELIPLRDLLLKQASNNNIFDLDQAFYLFDYTWNDKMQLIPQGNVEIYQIWQKVLNLIMPYVLSIIFVVISIKKFNWTSR